MAEKARLDADLFKRDKEVLEKQVLTREDELVELQVQLKQTKNAYESLSAKFATQGKELTHLQTKLVKATDPKKQQLD